MLKGLLQKDGILVDIEGPRAEVPCVSTSPAFVPEPGNGTVNAICNTKVAKAEAVVDLKRNEKDELEKKDP